MIDKQAINSIGIVLKVRYVACGLLDAGDTTLSDASPDQSGATGGRKAENSLRESGAVGLGCTDMSSGLCRHSS